MLASQGLDYRTTKKISKPKTKGSLKDFLLASDKQFNIEPDIKPKAPKNHDKNVLVFNGPFGVEHADLLVALLKACSGEVMSKLEERVRSMSRELVDLVIKTLRSCPKEEDGKLADQFAVMTSEHLDRLISMRPLDILGEMDLKVSVQSPLMNQRKIKTKVQKVKPITLGEMEPKDRLQYGPLKKMELSDLKEDQSLVEMKIEKEGNFEMEPKRIEKDNEVNMKDPGQAGERETKKEKNQKKIENSNEESVDFSHKFPSINPRY